MKSESQWQEIGSCPDCDAPLYKMGNQIKYHNCPYDRMDELVVSIRKLSKLVHHIDTMPIRKTPKEIIDEYLRSN